MELHPSAGHLAAAFTVALWGTTFIATKVLLTAFAPVEILLIRFVIGFFALLLVCPRLLRGTTPRQEGLFAAAGLCGICLYYLLENIALTHTLASNAGVIVSVAPFFTVLLSRLIHREERLSPFFLAGFVVAMAGIFLISFHGAQLQINPLGDGLALLAALVWAVYSLLTRKIAAFGYPTLLSNTLEVAPDGEILGHTMRCEKSKLTTVRALQSIGYETIASGDSFNDLGMIQASKAGFLFRTTEQIKKDYPQYPAYETFDDLLAAIRAAL